MVNRQSRAPAGRPPRGAAGHGVLPRGHRGGPGRARRPTPVPRRDPGRGRSQGRPVGRGGRQDPAPAGRPAAGRVAGRLAPRWPPPSTCGTRGSTTPGPRWSRPARRWCEQLAPLGREPTTPGWPARHTGRARLPALVDGPLLDALAEVRGPRTSSGGCRPSVPTATSWT